MSRMGRSASGSGGLVYSTEQGSMCPVCRKSVALCTCAKTQAPPAGDGTARVRMESQGRKGKSVTVVRGLAISTQELSILSRELKALCGVGGTAKDGAMELQGDHVERVLAALQARGLRAKRG